MKITRVESFRVKVPSKGDYRMARGVHDALRSVVVCLHTDAGIVGVGEAHQGVAGYSSETLGTAPPGATRKGSPVSFSSSVENGTAQIPALPTASLSAAGRRHRR